MASLQPFEPISEPDDEPLHFIFPDLPRRNNRLKMSSQVKESPLSLSATSSPISLPKSHIRRTRSELQLAAEIRHAKEVDIRMYIRLVVGIKSQIQRNSASGDQVHPLSRKSLQGIIRTKMADDQELEHQELNDYIEDSDDGWSVSHLSINDEVVESQTAKGMGTYHVEDDCIFRMEL